MYRRKTRSRDLKAAYVEELRERVRNLRVLNAILMRREFAAGVIIFGSFGLPIVVSPASRAHPVFLALSAMMIVGALLAVAHLLVGEGRLKQRLLIVGTACVLVGFPTLLLVAPRYS